MREGTVKSAAEYSLGSTQFTLLPSAARPFLDFVESIPDEQLAEDGRESELHITVLYGLKDTNPAPVRELISHRRPVRLRLGRTSLFQTDEADVLKLEVFSSQLRSLHNLIRENIPNEYSYPDYNPRLTLAYLKPGEGEQYADDARFEGQEFTFDRLHLCARDGSKTAVQLTGTPRNTYTAHSKQAAPNLALDKPAFFNYKQLNQTFTTMNKLASPPSVNPYTGAPVPKGPINLLGMINNPAADVLQGRLDGVANPRNDLTTGRFPKPEPGSALERYQRNFPVPKFHVPKPDPESLIERYRRNFHVPEPEPKPEPEAESSVIDNLMAQLQNNKTLQFAGGGGVGGGLLGYLLGGGKGAILGGLMGSSGGYLLNRYLDGWGRRS